MEDIISVSEIEKYTYCPLSWWLTIKGVSPRPETVKKVKEKRLKFKKQITMLRKIESQEKINELMIILLCFSATGLSIAGVVINYFYSKEITFITLTISSLWLILASFFLIGALKAAQISKIKRRSLNLPEGIIEYIGTKETEDIFSEEYRLIGKPDYILNIDNEHIPVEMKFGRVPRGPLFSHILEIVGYCILLKSRTGKQSSYGIIIYGDINYKIKVTNELTTILEKNSMK